MYSRIRTFDRKRFHGLFSTTQPLKSEGFVGGGFVVEMKLRRISPAQQNFPDKSTWIT